MKVVIFHGSPRIKGNTEILLNKAINFIEGEGHSVTLFRPSNMKLAPCVSCGGCEETGECVVEDDMVEVYRAINEGERFILISPIYFSGLTAQIKSLIDRCQALWCKKYLLKRPIHEGTKGRKGLLLMIGVIKKEDQYKCGDLTATAFFRTIGIPEHETLFFSGVDAKGAIRKHPTAFRDTLEACKRLLSD